MSNSNLKMIAILAMVIDHVGAILFPDVIIFRIIGRIAFPVFCFLLVEGYVHTRNVHKYMLRLLFFAFLSEVCYDLVFYNELLYWQSQNVFFELVLGLFLIKLIDCNRFDFKGLITNILYVSIVMFIADYFHLDYGSYGIFLILIFYLFRFDYSNLLLVFVGISIYKFINGDVLQSLQVLAIFPMYFYNGERGIRLRYFFYLVYPVHLILMYLVKT